MVVTHSELQITNNTLNVKDSFEVRPGSSDADQAASNALKDVTEIKKCKSPIPASDVS